MGSGGDAVFGGCSGAEGGFVEKVGFALRGLDLEGFEGSGGGRIVYFVVMRVCCNVRWSGREGKGRGM